MINKRLTVILTTLIIAAAGIFAAGSTEQDSAETGELVVFNAASTTDLVNDLGMLFYEETGITVKSNPASSGTLAKQLEQGAFADIFISASKKWMVYVEDLGLAHESSQFVQNRLVLIAPESGGMDFIELSEEIDFPNIFSGRLSMGDPAHVPAGKYAEEALEYYGWMDSLADRIQPATDVRAALLVVEMGETELGIVYETDALKSEKASVVGRFPLESHTPIVYYCAVLPDPSPRALLYYEFLLTSEDAKVLYTEYGFSCFQE